MKLTIKEQKVLEEVVENGLGAIRGNNLNDLLSDNFSWFDLDDLIGAGYSRSQLKGIISSLMKKMIVQIEDGCLFLSEYGIEVAQNLPEFQDKRFNKREI